ncbi:HpcH/HpaI aldolase/citrate lyase family protein [Chloroflexota bacterium]
MFQNRIKDKIRKSELAIGTYVNLADPAIVEIIGLAGFDAAFIDMEHTRFDLQLVEEMIRACDLVGISSLVRVPDNNPKTILRVLEMGAQGIQVPHISGRDDALAAVKAVRYAPLGERGMAGSTRATRYGTVPMREHMETSNSEIILAVMVEDTEAIRQLEEIASIEGIDLIAVGPTDLAQALGVSDTQDPRYGKTIEDISATLKKVDKARLTFPLNHPVYPLGAAELQRLGAAYANCGPSDVSRLLNSYRQQIQEIQTQL